jgi:hypothetical protein
MRKILWRTAYFTVLFVSVACVADAQATRTWVSGVGDDANPCSRTAPCKTFAGAISKTATGGEINCLDSGGFGAVTITKSMTIDCKSTSGGILAAQTTGIIINGNDAVVRLRGIDINGAGNGINGIRIMAAARVNVEEVVIDGFTQNGISVGNSGDIKIVVNNSSIRNNVGSGINGSSTGTTDIIVSDSLLSGNGAGITAGVNSTFRISNNTIAFNATGITAPQGKILSFKNNLIDGNGANGAPTSVIALQ